MEHNVGKFDSGIRWILAAVFFAISLVFNGNPGIALLAAVAALVMVATALTRTCPFYWVSGLHTCPRNSLNSSSPNAAKEPYADTLANRSAER